MEKSGPKGQAGGGQSSPRRAGGEETVRGPEKIFDFAAAEEVWFGAFSDFVAGLDEHVVGAEEEQLKFQDGRLFASLRKAIKAKARGKEEWVLLFACYEFVTNTSRHLGYDEAVRLHDEEMVARGLCSAVEFCYGMPRGFALAPEAGLLELHSRVRSVAAWMEAQISFSFWLVFKDFRRGWRGTMGERARAVAAFYLSQLHKTGVVSRVFRGYAGVPGANREW